jgi:pyridoxal phosphate phosphatase PHOSPHO2
MADQDTDRWIFEVLAPDIRRKMKTLKESIQWTDLMSVYLLLLSNQTSYLARRAQSLQEIHARGRTREEIEHTLRQMPFVSPSQVRE